MASSRHRSLQTSSITLPTSSGDRDFEIEFDAPGLSPTDVTHARPYLSFRVNPEGNTAVRVIAELNTEEIFTQTLGTDASRQMSEIFDHGVLTENGNELRFFVPNDDPGTVTVSDVIVTYTAA